LKQKSLGTILRGAAAAALSLSLSIAALAQAGAPSTETAPQQCATAFTDRVGADFMAGYRGDAAAFDRAMRACEESLAANARHAEALVWLGAATLFLAGQSFHAGDFQRGGELWGNALAQMDQAVVIEPMNPRVLIVRGMTLLAASRSYPVPDVARSLLEKAVADLEKTIKVMGPAFHQMPLDFRGDLLYGLGDGWTRIGDSTRARGYFQRVVDECKTSANAPRAAERLK
jgi:hypothetical protein